VTFAKDRDRKSIDIADIDISLDAAHLVAVTSFEKTVIIGNLVGRICDEHVSSPACWHGKDSSGPSGQRSWLYIVAVHSSGRGSCIICVRSADCLSILVDEGDGQRRPVS